MALSSAVTNCCMSKEQKFVIAPLCSGGQESDISAYLKPANSIHISGENIH